MNLICVIIGTALSVIFILLLLKGKKYSYMTDALRGDDFPLADVYCAGLALQEIPLFMPKGKLGEYLREKTKLVYTYRYSEFYTRIIWAQALSMGLLFSAVCFLLAGLLAGLELIMGLLGVVMLVLPGYVFISNVGDKVKNRREACEMEFPNAISKLALIVNSGVILHDAWVIVSNGNNGEFYDMMKKSCQEMANGKSDIDAIYEFGVATNSDEVKKFTSTLIQSMERGGGELPALLTNQSSELWAHKRQLMLQKGEQAASALLMPIALMFLGVMLIVIVAAMQSMGM